MAGGGATPRCGADPVPALAPVRRRRSTTNAVLELLQPAPAAPARHAAARPAGPSTNPQAGVWEVAVDARRTSDADGAPFTLTRRSSARRVSPNPDTIASATIGVPVARSLHADQPVRRVHRPGGRLDARERHDQRRPRSRTSLSSSTPSRSRRARRRFARRSAARPTRRPTSTCSSSTAGGACVLAGQSADGDSEESVTIANPAAGTWMVLVDGFAVPAGTTTYKYIDVFTNAAFGSVSVTDANALRPAGASWTVPGRGDRELGAGGRSRAVRRRSGPDRHQRPRRLGRRRSSRASRHSAKSNRTTVGALAAASPCLRFDAVGRVAMERRATAADANRLHDHGVAAPKPIR